MSLFDERKAAEAASYLLNLAGGYMSHTRLSALLYLAERESLRLYAEPLTGDLLVAVDTGPVLSRMYQFFTGRSSPLASPHISSWLVVGPRSGFDVRLRRPWRDWEHLSLSRLSRADTAILDGVWAQYGSMNRAELVDFTRHHCEEWTDPYGSARLIPYQTVLRHVGYSADVAAEIAQSLNEQALLNQALAA